MFFVLKPGSKLRVANGCQNSDFWKSSYLMNYTFIMCKTLTIIIKLEIFYKKNPNLGLFEMFLNIGSFLAKMALWGLSEHVYLYINNHKNTIVSI